MMRTFNCGVGFCLIVSKKNISKIKKYFQKIINLMRLVSFSKEKKNLNLMNSLKW